ncbi:MAG: hypothetical protein KC933_22515 [Myxococcales bacterium]|nr:hypothetical protein [Myxococcales bacterium]
MAFIATSIAIAALTHGSIRVARAVAGRWALPPFGAVTVGFALVVAGFVVPAGLVGRLTGHLDPGLAAAALAGVGLAAFGRTLAPTPGPAAPRRTRWAFAAVLAGCLAVYGSVAFQYQMHDEHAVFGHKSMVEQLRRGVYPPYLPPRPGEEVRYHYGFDLVSGSLARAYGLSSDLAIDLVCLLLVAFMTFAAAAVAADAGAVRSAPLAGLAVHFGAGLAFVMLAGEEGRQPRCLTQYHHPSCGVDLFPTQFLNVFQHPVSMGVPLMLTLVLLLPRLVTLRLAPPARSALAGATLAVLGAAALGQFVYYALAGLAALAAAPLWLLGERGEARPRWTGALWLVGVLAVSFGLAWLLGGMLAHNPSVDPHLFGRREVLGFPAKATLTGVLWHHSANLGLGFLLIPVFAVAALARRRRGVVMLLAFGVGGILAAHIFVYVRSWDIVKFPSAASYALSLLYVMAVDAALVGRAQPWPWVRRAGAALLMGSGLLAATYVVWPMQRDLQLYQPSRWRGDPLVAQAIAWLREHGYESSDVIFAQRNVAKELSVFGGLSVVAEDADLYYMGLRIDDMRRQRALSHQVRGGMDANALRALGVRWLVFSNEELNNLGPPARGALEDESRFEVVATFPGDTEARTRRIWRVK